MIGIACDHTSLKLKEELIRFLQKLGYEIKDFGTYTGDRTHYPIYAQKLCEAVSGGICEKGIAICGSGVGMGIAANKVAGIRCVICSEPYSAVMSRRHNDANVLAFGSRVVGNEMAKMISRMWLETEYESGRHQKRVDMIREIEEGIEVGD